MQKNNDFLIREKCPVCGAMDSKPIYKRSFSDSLMREYMSVAYQGNADLEMLDGVFFQLQKCNFCGFIFQKVVLSESKVIELYDKWIPQMVEKKPFEYIFKARLAYVSKLMFAYRVLHRRLNKSPLPIRVLDYGAGFGELPMIAKSLGFQALAFEIGEQRTKALKSQNICLLDKGARSIEKCHYIILNQILEHVANPATIMKDISKLLDDDGLVYLAVPNCSNIESYLKRAINIFDAKELHRTFVTASISAFQHINFFNPSTLKKLIRNSGFKIVFCPLKEMATFVHGKRWYYRYLIPLYRPLFHTGLYLEKK